MKTTKMGKKKRKKRNKSGAQQTTFQPENDVNGRSGSDWRWVNAPPGVVANQDEEEEEERHDDEERQEEFVDDDEDDDSFLPFVPRDVVIGSLVRKTIEMDGWEERAKIVVDKAKAMIRPPRKKKKKKDMSGGGVGVDGGKKKKDNRPRWARRPWMVKKTVPKTRAILNSNTSNTYVVQKF